MLPEVIRQFNWVDIFVIIVLLRTIYIAVKNGLTSEAFKLPGIIFALYLSLHYYTTVSDLIQERLPVKEMPLEFLDFIFFLILATFGYLVFVLLRNLFCRFIKMEAAPNFNRWIGLFLGIARSFFLVGLLTFGLAISSINYLKVSTRNSYLGSQFCQIAPATYTWIWNNITSKFMAQEKLNPAIEEVQKDFSLK